MATDELLNFTVCVDKVLLKNWIILPHLTVEVEMKSVS